MRTALIPAVGLLALTFAAPAQQPPAVVVTDHGAQTSVAGPGAPAHIVGLPRTMHLISLDAGARTYGLRYLAAHDPKRPDVAIPGEGYIGMPQPSDCNWYGGGFFDLQINGQTLGTTLLHSFTGRSTGDRGYADFVFDASVARVRVRFVAIAGSDVLYAQALLEPKTDITGLRVVLRCYPSAFVSDAERHVLTPARDLRQGEKADLDPATEYWLLYYDRIVDHGSAASGRQGVGPCAVLWPPQQPSKATFTVASYGIDTVLDMDPRQRDLRFVFIDFAGTRNDASMEHLRNRAKDLVQGLAGFRFGDAGVAEWPLAEKQKDIDGILAAMPAEKESAAAYARWAAELKTQLAVLRAGATGSIMAEAAAAKTIAEWEAGIPALRLKALLQGI